jgi:hypothetical protein
MVIFYSYVKLPEGNEGKTMPFFFDPFGNGLFIPPNGDDRGMVYGIVFF